MDGLPYSKAEVKDKTERAGRLRPTSTTAGQPRVMFYVLTHPVYENGLEPLKPEPAGHQFQK